MAKVQYAGISPEAFEAFKSKIQQVGVSLQGNNGNFSEKGVSGAYAYNPETQELVIDELNVGFPASMMIGTDSLVQRMTELVKQNGGRMA
ncbi:hypothetical protein [Pontibacter arcticus]|uniref:Uncharacterized protein n=1 Tax=Pontibacter arcticus TaxID=2080288 RepID=A0A364RF93_9BACT|nr:hypothetical protein [Pontibacter arcticus]RAU82937.1 hypothetical protein DP923_06750 [Pontibacter arcticus]